MRLYSYNKLDPQRREIRLCTLHPGSLDDPLVCTLSTISLDDKPEYETLSYVWGDPTFNKEIRENGDVLRVTTSLHTALRYLRFTENPRVIWADGICINQGDLNERSSQVGMMGDIYRAGKELQVWLGEAEEVVNHTGGDSIHLELASENALNDLGVFLQSQGLLTNPPSLHSASVVTESPDSSLLGALEILLLLVADEHMFRMPFYKLTHESKLEFNSWWYQSLSSLTRLLSLAWWRRLWTFQETLLSSRSTVHIGIHEVPLSYFLHGLKKASQHLSGCCSPLAGLWLGSIGIFRRMNSLINLVLLLDSAIKSFRSNAYLRMDELYIMSSRRESSDPLDKVYAINSLVCPQETPKLFPDYHISPAELYTEATRHAFSEEGSLNLLDYAVGTQYPTPFDSEYTNPFNLPSWVSDWRHDSQPRIYAPLYNASHSLKHKTQTSGSRSLVIKGAFVGVVSKIGEVLPALLESCFVEKLRQWRLLAGSFHNYDMHTFLKVIFLDFSISPEEKTQRMTTETLSQLELWWNASMSANSMAIRSDFSVHLSKIRKQHRIYATSQGILGMGPLDLHEGDRIFVVEGSTVPLCLRPLEGALAEDETRQWHEIDYLFVGTCYHHGVMDGEAVAIDTKWQELLLH